MDGVNRVAGAVCGGRSRVGKIWRVESGEGERLEKDLGEFVLLVEERSCRASQGKSSTYIFSSFSLFRCEDQLGRTRLVVVVTGGRRRLVRRWPLVAAERVSGGSQWTARCRGCREMKKPKLPSAEKTHVGAVPSSSARVKHLVVVADVINQACGATESVADQVDAEEAADQGSPSGVSE
ncbi:hypothetical protein ACE6H2_026584 [Prunus campanulata]